MPLFSRHAEPEPAPAPVHHEPAPKRHSLFGGSRHNRSPSPGSPTYSNSSASTMDRHRSTSRDSSGHKPSLLSRTFGNGVSSSHQVDPSIMQARERVMMAESAERDADRALMAARESVRQAREHVRALELEAQEEARRAKIKQYHAKEVSKRGKQLGRHGL
ncbi:unnamed protein product [Sordaria macrospora k-hell]|uniref:WGS project CABT00000000 data, contig 2.105 n=1 Tax=Sordaria macrospora (strain ATCC MYA-333 / DSM 997 / K(L3346) / K-hell) TaxID=771870 RepID=F7WCA0_SORMK|nr:uncharacterized protein SMAC_09593 [Sordaria macrospora k-hell]KAH7628905.1 hypothetical protein B0T09DRAFT_169141 [Sordaria sp. MPI-SDFR-AT-0083]CCC05573.1 unnamed protein product [Sordaria macrospora k-hell]